MVEVVAAGQFVQVLGLVFLHSAGVDVTQIVTHQGFQGLEVAGEDGLRALVVQRFDVGNGVSGGGGAHGCWAKCMASEGPVFTGAKSPVRGDRNWPMVEPAPEPTNTRGDSL